ncbi:MAG: hypothetical protein QNK37_06630 [Acidobacteriota bacterium]|nr:hypothetical protein [Acidobacteriota bacterium]
MWEPLMGTAALIALVHTLAGPDHYLPFIALARSRNWSERKALLITAGCCIGHVIGSVALGFAGIALGKGVSQLSFIETFRGDIAGWFLLGFGVVYLIYGLRHAWVNRHGEAKDPGHRHGTSNVTPWVLFIIFVLGPCEPLIPLLMYPAFNEGWFQVAAVAGIFSVVTLTTMLLAVSIGLRGISIFKAPWLTRYAQALAGGALAACGLAIQLGL